ncbi:MAG: hypothetical protein U7123_09885 [Potamolinea sp.]
MIISDLNHLQVVEAETKIEGGSFYEYDYVKGSVLFGSLTVGLAYGNVAVADAGASAYGYDTFTKAATSTVTTPYYSGSGAFSISVSN